MHEDRTAKYGPWPARLVAVGALLAHLLAMVAVLAVFVKIAPTYRAYFSECEMTLPAATQQVLALSQCVKRFGPTALAVVLGLDSVVLVGLAWGTPRRWWLLWGWTTLGLLAVVLLLTYVSLALWLPLAGLGTLC